MSQTELAGPRHLAMIMDGNRRWAKEKGLPSVEGHRAGYETMKKVGDWCLERSVEILTVYAFSTENWKRSETEVGFLMTLLEHALDKELDYFISRKIKLRILGRREGFKPRILELIDKAQEATKDFDAMTFAICLNYGGRTELVDAVKEIVAEGMQPEAIDELSISKRLYWPNMPDPDMIVRTSGEERLSGFLLWQSAYSEFYWLKKNWPAIDEKDIDVIIEEYKTRQRRYGK
ncbi:di-trans,poly-cis-decaprenylcistransferase [Candidatus Uhrbacteria bacterium]|nr:MAG: di-trans,poly-cis-decaprenylcistransferase [Candidatus Uhrbacteria bacterium]